MPPLARELSKQGTIWGKKLRGIAEKAGAEFLEIGRNTFEEDSPAWRKKPHTGEWRITKTQAGEEKRRVLRCAPSDVVGCTVGVMECE